MARDVGLEELVRDQLGATPGLSESSMFGGRSWLLDGNLLCAAPGRRSAGAAGQDAEGWALEIADVVAMISRGRRMRGWIRAGPDAFGDDGVREKLIDAALSLVGRCRRSRA